MIAQSIVVLLLIIFALGGIAILLSQLNILWPSFFGIKRNCQPPLVLKVVERHEMSATHFSVRLQTISTGPLTNFLPGQYLTLITPHYLLEEPVESPVSKDSLKRCYSLSAWGRETNFYELGIQRQDGGKASTWLHKNLQLGTLINALPPKGNFIFNAEKAQHTILIAGGIGITPLRAMIHQFIEHQFIMTHGDSSFTNKTMHLFYGARSVEDMCYADEFIQLAHECPSFMFYPFLSQAISNTTQGPHPFTFSRLSAEKIAQKLDLPLGEYNYYLCGPNAMMDDFKSKLVQRGVAPDNIHFERFGIDTSSANNKEFLVKLGGNKSFVFNEQRTLLDAMDEQLITVESECRTGECGQCKVNLLSGSIKPLIEVEFELKAGEILPCCCVPESDLLIKP